MKEMRFAKGLYKAFVNEYKWNGTYSVNFWYDDLPNYSFRGTYGTALKEYETLDKAISAAKRYINKAK